MGDDLLCMIMLVRKSKLPESVLYQINAPRNELFGDLSDDVENEKKHSKYQTHDGLKLGKCQKIILELSDGWKSQDISMNKLICN